MGLQERSEGVVAWTLGCLPLINTRREILHYPTKVDYPTLPADLWEINSKDDVEIRKICRAKAWEILQIPSKVGCFQQYFIKKFNFKLQKTLKHGFECISELKFIQFGFSMLNVMASTSVW